MKQRELVLDNSAAFLEWYSRVQVGIESFVQEASLIELELNTGSFRLKVELRSQNLGVGG